MKNPLSRFFKNKMIVGSSTETVHTPDGPIATSVTTVEPYPQAILELTEEELRSIHHDAALASEFISVYTQSPVADEWRLEDLESAFAIWTGLGHEKPHSEQAVLDIVGSAFGEHCVQQLAMRWVKVRDEDGTDYAVRSELKEVMAFPYSSVLKRIESEQHTFIVPIFFSVKEQIESQDTEEVPKH